MNEEKMKEKRSWR